MHRKFAAILVLVAVAITGCGVRRTQTIKLGTTSNAGDKFAEDLLANKSKCAEARAWLAPDQKNHAVMEGDNKQALAFVEKMYAAGALNVQVAEITRISGKDYTAIFVITLPTDPDARKAVIAAFNKAGKDFDADFDNETDEGQKYLVFNTD
jgi:hypothetical protein